MARIANQIKQNQDKDGMLRRALERIIQLYTDKSHFIYELLQNAEDAGAKIIRFEQYADRLEVLHDGHAFSCKNLESLCDIGKSDKTENLNQIGEFGVGFKSVFGICETVRLYSRPKPGEEDSNHYPFAIEIEDFTNPVDIESEDIPEEFTTKFVFPYSVGYKFSGFDTIDLLNESLSKRLQNLGITTLLFMKNLQSIEYKILLPDRETSGAYILEKQQITDSCCLVSALGETKESQEDDSISYLVFSRPVSGIQLGRTIDIAFTVRLDSNGDYSFLPTETPYISVYFPTETESKLNFIVQGPFRTTPNRSSIPFEDKDNIKLAEQLAILLRDSVIELRNMKKLNYSLLNILPIDRFFKYTLFPSPLLNSMVDETKKMMTNERVLPCEAGCYITADSAMIARSSELTEVFTDALLTELYKKQYHWLPTFITEGSKEYGKIYQYLTNELNVEVIRPENLKDEFNDNEKFLRHRDNDWLIKLYEMYYSVPAAFSKQKGGSNMLTASIIKTTKGDFVPPYRKSTEQDQYYSYGNEKASYIANVFLPIDSCEEADDINFVDKELLDACPHFFYETLNLQKPDEYEYFTRGLKRRYKNYTEIPFEQHIADLNKLLYFSKNPDYTNEVSKLLEKYIRPFFECTYDRKQVKAGNNLVYLKTTDDGFDAEQYLEGVVSYHYLNELPYKENGINCDDLVALGVVRKITLARNLTKVRGEYYNSGKRGKKPEWHSLEDFRYDLQIEFQKKVLEYIEMHPDSPIAMVKSSIIFQFLKKYEKHLQGYLEISGNNDNIPNAKAFIIRALIFGYETGIWKGKWLYDKNLNLVSQREISKYELSTELYGQVDKSSSIYEFLHFQVKEDDRYNDKIQEFNGWDEDNKQAIFESELMRKYNISLPDFEKAIRGSRNSIQDNDKIIYSGFPALKIKNWDTLRKHVAEEILFSNPKKYEYKVRRLRVSRPDKEIETYLKSMYRIESSNLFACQMCHSYVLNIEKCQLAADIEKEFTATNLCLCPNCAAKYRNIQRNEASFQEFIDSILGLSEDEINDNSPVKINLCDETIWFTQVHIAEISEIVKLIKTEDESEYNIVDSIFYEKENTDSKLADDELYDFNVIFGYGDIENSEE